MPCYRQMTAVIRRIFVNRRMLTVVFPTLSTNGPYNAEAPRLVPLPAVKKFSPGCRRRRRMGIAPPLLRRPMGGMIAGSGAFHSAEAPGAASK